MPFLLAPPAQVAPPPGPAQVQVLGRLQGLFEAVPAALVEGRRGAMRGLVGKAKAEWDRAKPELRKVMTEPEVTAMDRQLKAMGAMKPREQAAGALGLATTLAGRQPRSPRQDLLAANRTAMMAWCVVDDGQWALVPRVAAAYQPLLDQDQGRHPRAVQGLREALGRYEEGLKKRQGPAAKQALKDVLSQAEALGKA